MQPGHFRNVAGAACFGLATAFAVGIALDQPSILVWLNAAHNGILTACYLRRRPAKAYDRTGLWLGVMAAFLPTVSNVAATPEILLLPALAGYGLILWSLVTLGPRFGIAPADRGLTCRGPYRGLRHPMYLGELVFRLTMIFSSPEAAPAVLWALVLGIVQIIRIRREERTIAGYGAYARLVPWRLIPGVW